MPFLWPRVETKRFSACTDVTTSDQISHGWMNRRQFLSENDTVPRSRIRAPTAWNATIDTTAKIEASELSLLSNETVCEGGKIVKRVLALLVCLVIFTASAAPALACRRHHRSYATYGYRP